MPTIRQLRRRIRSVASTAKITKAMEMIAASRMRKAQERGLKGRPYADKMLQVLGDLVAAQPTGDGPVHPLLEKRSVCRIEIIHITTDRGLCGGLNANVNRRAAAFILEQGKSSPIVAVGRKGFNFMASHGLEVRAEFPRMGDNVSMEDILPIARVAMEDYTSKYVDEVFLSYPQFVNTMLQRPVIRTVLPIKPAEFPPGQNVDYIYEPASVFVLRQLLPRFLEMQVYQAVVESIASEHSARMVAMRSATDNANDLVQDLTLTLNKARQEAITKELLDIVGGSEALV